MAPRRSSDLAALALAALSAAAALTLGRVFRAGEFAAPVLGAALAPHALGLLGRRFRWSIAATLLISFAGLFAYVAWALVPADTTYGLPTFATLEAIGRDLGDGFDALRTAKAPAPVTTGAVVLAVIAVWFVAQLADLLAFHRFATIGAIAPALGLFVWASSLGTDTLALRSTILFGAAALVFLLVQHQALLERQRARFSGRRLGLGTGLVAFGALAAVVALAGGALLGPALPGADAGPLLDVKGLGDGGGGDGGDRSYRAEPPLARIGENFDNAPEQEVFTVAADREEYWRIAALDRYSSDDGGLWTISARGPEVGTELDPDADDGTALTQNFRITGLDGFWMPAAYEPVSASVDVNVVLASTTLVVDNDEQSVLGLDYTVESSVPAPADVATARQRAQTNDPLPDDVEQYTELPEDFPTLVGALAEDVTAAATTPFDEAMALEQFFLDPASGFTYSLDVDLGSGAQSESAIETFLQPGNRVGFCVQFAGSFATMARSLGLPARVAVGYTPGTFDDASGRYVVTNRNAHAWPEVYLSGLGWTRFEPTPPSAGTGQGGSDLPGREEPANGGIEPPVTTAVPGPTVPPVSTPGMSPGLESQVDIGSPTDAPSDDVGDGLSVPFTVAIAIGVLAFIGLGLAAVGIVVAKSRRRAERRARPDPEGAIRGAWEQLVDQLIEDGQPIDPSRTPFELVADTSVRIPVSDRPLHDLAERYSDARYGPGPSAAADADAAWEDVDAIETALSRVRSKWERLRRRLDPSPLRSRR